VLYCKDSYYKDYTIKELTSVQSFSQLLPILSSFIVHMAVTLYASAPNCLKQYDLASTDSRQSDLGMEKRVILN